mgnify:CR=1 FL=1|jgi:transcriptional regulator with PAS, ATPase and Fis domain
MIVCKRYADRVVLVATRPGERITLEGARKALLRAAVREAATTTAAAALLGISQQALRRHAAKYGLSLPRAGAAP